MSGKTFFDEKNKRYRFGFAYDQDASVQPAGPLRAGGLAVEEMWAVTSATVSHIAQIFVPEKRKELGSVVGGYEQTRQAFQISTSTALVILAFISLSLGVINLFPFLPLDGGHIFWALAEKVRGRAIPFSVMERAGFVGFALVIALFLVGLTNDLDRLAERRLPTPVASRAMGERSAVGGAATIAEAFRLTVADHPDRIAVRTLHDEVAYTWAQLRDKVDALAGGLHRLGVRRGDTVALMISNRPEFMIADLAAMTLGATPFSIYLTSAPDQVALRHRRRRGARSRSSRRRSGRSSTRPSSSTCSSSSEDDAGRARTRLRRRAALARGRARRPPPR